MWSVGVRPRSAAHRIDQRFQLPVVRLGSGFSFLPLPLWAEAIKTNPSSDLVSYQIYTTGMPTAYYILLRSQICS